MAGLLPATARRVADAGPSRAVELTLGLDLWLGARGTRLRGYLDTTWELIPGRALAGCAAERERRFDLVARGPVLGSRVHINFAAQPNFLRTFSSTARASAGAGRP